MTATHEVLAVRYGARSGTRSETFYKYGVYHEPDGPLPMDYFFWVIRNGTDVILVDSGFSAGTGARLNRSLLIEPVDALARLGISAESVSQLIVSHGHYDHIGNLSAFPEAVLIVQQRELDHWTSDLAHRCPEMFFAEPSEIDEFARAERQGRLRAIDGDRPILPGVSVELVGGHCPGQQIVIVDGEQGQVVLASDALHFYEEMERDMPFITFTNLVDMYSTYETLRQYEGRGATIVAGHDPEVTRRFPSAASGDSDPSLAVRVG